ncbi:galactose mutarotase [Ornithinimicrobium murale]|uniref:aldose epimerase family protein n=1 Tax=Ornithinimicrobium murale TaxID=1050153 RepID=UPI001EE09A30|nr:galactose mutarotase [Ornithinimicrobium murale]
MPTPAPPQTHDHVTLRAGRYTATTTADGGALGSLRHDDRDLVLPSGLQMGRPAYEGAICAPWPNRVVDGQWEHEGHRHQLAITEPERGHALHGFVHDQGWTLLEATGSTARWGLDTQPQPGYPWSLRLTTAYELDAEGGLTWQVTAQQHPTGAEPTSPAPYGVTVHPYFVAGAGPAQDWTLELPAESALAVDDRLVPQELVPVGEAGLDLRTGRTLGEQPIDHAFGGLTARVARLTTPAGSGVEVTWSERHRWVQVFTAQWDARRPRHAVALEPMTCPPDAFNSGTDLIMLTQEPVTVGWQVRAL